RDENPSEVRRHHALVGDAARERSGVRHVNADVAASDDLAWRADLDAAGDDAGAVHLDAVAACEDSAAVDDRALDSAFENANANAGRNRPAIADAAGELSDAVDMAEVGRRKAEPDASRAGDDLSAIGDAPGEYRGDCRNTREAGADRA